MTGKNDVESPFKTNHVPSQDSEVDNFCMRCGGKLDDRTKQCPRCDTPSNIPEETDRIFQVQGPFHAPPPPPPPPVGRKAPIPSPSQHPIFQIPPSPAAPRSSTPIPKIYIAVGIVVVVIIIALVFALGVRSGYSNHVGTPTVQVTPATTVITRPATTTDNLASQYWVMSYLYILN